MEGRMGDLLCIMAVVAAEGYHLSPEGELPLQRGEVREESVIFKQSSHMHAVRSGNGALHVVTKE